MSEKVLPQGVQIPLAPFILGGERYIPNPNKIDPIDTTVSPTPESLIDFGQMPLGTLLQETDANIINTGSYCHALLIALIDLGRL